MFSPSNRQSISVCGQIYQMTHRRGRMVSSDHGNLQRAISRRVVMLTLSRWSFFFLLVSLVPRSNVAITRPQPETEWSTLRSAKACYRILHNTSRVPYRWLFGGLIRKNQTCFGDNTNSEPLTRIVQWPLGRHTVTKQFCSRFVVLQRNKY